MTMTDTPTAPGAPGAPAALHNYPRDLPPTGCLPHSGRTHRNDGEPLIERALTFRESTYDALAVYVQQHQEHTGRRLTMAAAVDWLLRRQLGRYGPAVREALRPPGFDMQ